MQLFPEAVKITPTLRHQAIGSVEITLLNFAVTKLAFSALSMKSLQPTRFCQTLRVFGPLIQMGIFMLCCVQIYPLEVLPFRL
jgi:hypothetical protein